LARIQAAQSSPDNGELTQPGEAAARGLKDLDPDPSAAKKEKDESRNPDLQPDRKRRVRGKGRNK
jgi:hypothetical protein